MTTQNTGARLVPEPSIGRWLAQLSATGEPAGPTASPLDGSTLVAVPRSTPADVEAAFATARAAQPGWAAWGASCRGRVLLEFHDLLLAEQAQLADVIIAETGKSRRDAVEEIFHTAMTARYYGHHAAGMLAPERRRGIVPGLTRIDVHHHPKGVVSVISPWNYPLTMGFSDGIAALAAGNTVVAKPDAQTMLTALAGLELLRAAGVPEGAWQMVAGPGAEVGGALVDRGDAVCFTGSTRIGRAVGIRAAERLVGASLELGGKNPMIVCADADLGAAVDGAIRGCFGNAGQLRASFERLYVAREVFDRFLAGFVAATQALELRPGCDWSADVGTLTSAAQLAKVAGHVEDARGRGATVRCGGRARPDLAPFSYEPTVLTDVPESATLFGEETFGPVVAVYPFDTEDEAITAANDSAHGLHAAVWTRDRRRGRALASRIRCGTVNVNEAIAASFASLAAPMGGLGDSGLGRRQGPEGLLRFTETQAVVTQRGLGLGTPAGLGRGRDAQVMTRALRVLRHLRW